MLMVAATIIMCARVRLLHNTHVHLCRAALPYCPATHRYREAEATAAPAPPPAPAPASASPLHQQPASDDGGTSTSGRGAAASSLPLALQQEQQQLPDDAALAEALMGRRGSGPLQRALDALFGRGRFRTNAARDNLLLRRGNEVRPGWADGACRVQLGPACCMLATPWGLYVPPRGPLARPWCYDVTPRSLAGVVYL